MENTEKSSKKSALSFAAIGLSTAAICIFIYWQKSNFISNSIPVSGIVEKTQTHGTGDSKEYSVVVSYTDANGNMKTSMINGSSNLKSYNNGDVIELRYEAQSPDSIIIDSFWELWGIILMILPLSLLFLAVGVREWIKSGQA